MTRSQLLVAAALAAGCIAAGDIAYAQAPVPPNAPGLTTRRLEFNNVTTNAPYSADFTSTVTQVLADGTRIQQSATGKVYRDTAGRMRREQQVLGIAALTPGANPAAVVTITDPTTRTTYTINDQARTATKAPYARALEYELPFGWPGAANWTVAPGTNDLRAVRVLADQLDRLRVRTSRDASGLGLDVGQGARQGGGRGGRTGGAGPGGPSASAPESLGSRQMEGVTATGTRITTTIPTGQIGNDRPIVITDETWDSPDLHTIVYSKHHDPRTGDIEYRLRNINRNEPAATLFQIPAGYNVIDPLGAALGGRGGGGRGGAPATPAAPRVPGQ
jgi:hypothetical protein